MLLVHVDARRNWCCESCLFLSLNLHQITQTNRFRGFSSSSSFSCEQRKWKESPCGRIILQHLSPPALISLCESIGVWGVQTVKSVIESAEEWTVHPPLDPETANQLQASGQTLCLHYAWSSASSEAAGESTSLIMFTDFTAVQQSSSSARGSRHEPHRGKPSSSWPHGFIKNCNCDYFPCLYDGTLLWGRFREEII